MATVLVVDDSKVMRRSIKSVIAQAGHKVIGEAENGQLAYEAYSELKPDVVTMDVAMPVMDGVEAAQRILKSFPEANIIMVSAQNQEDLIIQAAKAGIKNYFLKPLQAEKVKQILDSIAELT